jgi:hypothetical protein
VAARAAVVRLGESRSGPEQGWEGGGEAGEGTWPSAERRWGGGGAAHGRQSGGGVRELSMGFSKVIPEKFNSKTEYTNTQQGLPGIGYT